MPVPASGRCFFWQARHVRQVIYRSFHHYDGYRGRELGLRAPGTGLPGILSAGTFYKNGDRQFVFIGPKTHPVVIELANEKWKRIVLGVADARSTAAEVSRAIAA